MTIPDDEVTGGAGLRIVSSTGTLSAVSIRAALWATTAQALALLAGCGSGTSAETPTGRAVPQTDAEIAQLLYTDSERTPPGFYSEPQPSAGYAATFHIRNADISAVATPSAPVFELCSDDWNEALGWSESVANTEPVYSDLASTDTSEQFFEFVRIPRGSEQTLEQMRVYRCEFLDRQGADVARLTGAAGHLNKRPMTAADVRWTLEYLWHFSRYNNVDNVVLKSAPVTGAASPSHELILAALVRGSGMAGCDRVHVFGWRYRTDAATGELTSEQRDLWTFDARSASGTAQVCGT